MFDLSSLDEQFDGVLCLWQSFGYGDSDQNAALLAEMRRVLRPGGRLLLDVYNADAVQDLPDSETQERGGRTVQTTRTYVDRRLRVELEYSDSAMLDIHEWEVYSPSELEDMAAEVDLDVVVRCAWFDPSVPPDRQHLRMQYLFERGET
jgi:SAM-dependent methyltransferase